MGDITGFLNARGMCGMVGDFGMGVEGEETWRLLWVPEREIKPSRYEICHKFPRESEADGAASLHVLNAAVPPPATPLSCAYALTSDATSPLVAFGLIVG